MKKEARESDGRRSARELDDVLRGLGLRVPQSTVRREAARSDQQRGLRDAGQRARPPSSYRELYDAYIKSLSITEDK
jgi:hypothetical protein